MASNVYSHRLLYREGAGGQSDFVVPDKKRCIVRQLICRSEADVQSQVFLGVHGIWAWSVSLPDAFAGVNEQFFVVAYERETVSIFTTGTDTRCIVMGYLFDDPEGKPAETKPTPPGSGSITRPSPRELGSGW